MENDKKDVLENLDPEALRLEKKFVERQTTDQKPKKKLTMELLDEIAKAQGVKRRRF